MHAGAQDNPALRTFQNLLCKFNAELSEVFPCGSQVVTDDGDILLNVKNDRGDVGALVTDVLHILPLHLKTETGQDKALDGPREDGFPVGAAGEGAGAQLWVSWQVAVAASDQRGRLAAWKCQGKGTSSPVKEGWSPKHTLLLSRRLTGWLWMRAKLQELQRSAGKRKPQPSGRTTKNGKPQETRKYRGDDREKGGWENKPMTLSANFWARRQATRTWIWSQTA